MKKIIDSKYLKLTIAFALLFLLASCGGGGGNSSTDPVTISSSSLPVISASASSVAASISSSVASSSGSSSSPAKSTLELVTIPSPSVTGNLVDGAAAHAIRVYLPKSYYTQNTALPVIYYLPGFGDETMLDVNLPLDLDTAMNGLSPTIVVIVSGVNRFGGSFFVDSSVTGNWSTYVTTDVVGYVDAHYRTIPNSRSRGISGHSMGGFGALNLAMRHPEIFGSVFALSPGLVSELGMTDTQIFDSDSHIKSFITSLASTTNMNDLALNVNGFDIAYGLAFAPSAAFPYFEYPYTIVNNQLVRDENIWAKWQSGFGDIHNKVVTFKTNFTTLNGIGFDCGTADEYQWIPRGCNYFDAQLTAQSISHTYTTHGGHHQDLLKSRIQTVMLPFFSAHLATQ